MRAAQPRGATVPEPTTSDRGDAVRAAQSAVDALATRVDAASDAAIAAGRVAKDARLPSRGAVKAVLSGRYRSSLDQADADAAIAGERLETLRQQLSTARRDLDRASDAYAVAVARDAQELADRRAASAERIRAAGGPDADRLAQLETDLAAAENEGRELDEAARAVESAQKATARALERLNSASSWGTYDTWFGRGIVSSSIKHDRIDDAARAMDAVRDRLALARRELADVTLDLAAPDLASVGANRTLDIWFDNIFSDLGTQSRISDGRDRVVALDSALRDAHARVGAHAREVQRRIADLSAERESVLDAAAP
jgi:DNA repair exonuclease SbcCD ATPase subunit